MVVPFGGKKEKDHLKKGLNRVGYKTQDADKDGDDAHVDETKEAPRGTYFTKSGNLVKGRLSKAAKERGARETDPKDKTRSKVPPVTQSNENSLREALGKIKKKSEIFVDMDGVLADFFGEWSKSQGVDNWKDIKDPAQAIGDIKDCLLYTSPSPRD